MAMNSLLTQCYTRSIRLTPDGFSLYCLRDDGKYQDAFYPAAENALISDKAPRFFNMEQDSGQAIDIVIATRMPLLVPDVIYDESTSRAYLETQFDLSQYGQHFCDTLGHYKSLYFLTQNEYSTLAGLPCTPRFLSEATLLYRFLQDQQHISSVLLSINKSFADILAVQKGEILLINRTHHIENVDLLYYTLNSVQQLGLSDPMLYVQNFDKANKKLTDLLANYIDNITIL